LTKKENILKLFGNAIDQNLKPNQDGVKEKNRIYEETGYAEKPSRWEKAKAVIKSIAAPKANTPPQQTNNIVNQGSPKGIGY